MPKIAIYKVAFTVENFYLALAKANDLNTTFKTQHNAQVHSILKRAIPIAISKSQYFNI